MNVQLFKYDGHWKKRLIDKTPKEECNHQSQTKLNVGREKGVVWSISSTKGILGISVLITSMVCKVRKYTGGFV